MTEKNEPSRRGGETPTEFRASMLEVYGERHWEVMRNFILNGSDPVEVGDSDDLESDDFDTELTAEDILGEEADLYVLSDDDVMNMDCMTIDEAISDNDSVVMF